MEFKNMEIIVNSSMLLALPPLFVVGPNRIGKTEALKAVAHNKKSVKFTTGMDYGGLKQFIGMRDLEKKTIVLSDMQQILSRKKPVMEATLGYISTLTSEGVFDELTYKKTGSGGEEERKMNIIIGATPKHIARLTKLEQFDLLTRFLYIIVERDIKEVNLKIPYQLHSVLPKKIDKRMAKNKDIVDELDIKVSNIGYRGMINNVYLGLRCCGYPKEFCAYLTSNVMTYEIPEETDYNWRTIYNKVMKPLH